MPRHSLLTLGAACGAVLLAACGEVTPPEPCTEGSTGTLAVTVSGVPMGGTADVAITGPGGPLALTTSQTFTGIATGSYTLSAQPAYVADSLFSRAFGATPTPRTVCVRDGATASVSVTYAAIPTAGRLWYGAGFYTLGFDASQLLTTATLAPAVVTGTRGGNGVTFDRVGNLWVRGQSASDPVLMRYPASVFSATGNPLPDRTIGISGLTCLSPGSLAFDGGGNLWLSIGCQGRIVRLTSAQLAGSGTVLPTVQITNLVNPQGLAFDPAGNLWVADDTQLRRYDAARLSATISGAADLSLTFTTPTPPAPGLTGLRANHLAFHPDGELWVVSSAQQALYRVEGATRALGGAQANTPTRILYLEAGTTPKGFAFDNAGGLYVGTTISQFGRLSPTQLGSNSTPAAPTVPQRFFASASILGFGDDIAIFPAPAATPLFHRVR